MSGVGLEILKQVPLAVASAFHIPGTILESRPFGGGHINDTFVAEFGQAGTRVRYLFQRINDRIFREPKKVMENIGRVCAAASQRLSVEDVPDPSRRTLTVVESKDGRLYHVDEQGGTWRCYLFIEGARTYDIVRNPRQAFEAAKAFGAFQNLASGIVGDRLHETIPYFHNTRMRFERLRVVVAADPCGRLASVADEWNFIRDREEIVDTLLDLLDAGEIPERITHNDTKLNNVMIDDTTESGICVIDLDTVMPGLALYDFGDLVRTATSPVSEDERDISKVRMQMPMFDSLARGYLAGAGGFLNQAEKAHLAFSGKLITLEVGMRFLTDHLEGDVYFKTKHEGHNLDRCRTQLALVRSIEEQEESMQRVVDSL